MKSSMTATRLRLYLSILMFALVATGLGLFILGYQQISKFSQEARDMSVKSEASNSTVQNLIDTEKLLKKETDTVERASLLVAESKSYMYQDQIISDINKYASDSGIEITNISFTDLKTTAVSTPTVVTATVNPTPTGVRSMTATVTLKNPMPYNSMLKFIHLVEQSLFKMRISAVTLSKTTDEKAPDGITSDVLTIEVYVR